MSDLRRMAARLAVGSLLAVGVGYGLFAAGLSGPAAAGAGVGVGVVVGRVLFGKSALPTGD